MLREDVGTVLKEFARLAPADQRAVASRLSSAERRLLKRLAKQPTAWRDPSAARLASFSPGMRKLLRRALAPEGAKGSATVTPATRQVLMSFLSAAGPTGGMRS